MIFEIEMERLRAEDARSRWDREVQQFGVTCGCCQGVEWIELDQWYQDPNAAVAIEARADGWLRVMFQGKWINVCYECWERLSDVEKEEVYYNTVVKRSPEMKQQLVLF